MPRYFTHYWKNTTVDTTENDAGELLGELYSRQFTRRGVAPGDHLYAITVRAGVLYLIGKIIVGSLAYIAEDTDLSEGSAEEGVQHEAGYTCAIAAEGTPITMDRMVPAPIIAVLRFQAGTVVRTPVFTPTGLLEQQTLRSLRELTPNAAAALDQLLEPLAPVEEFELFQATADSEALE